MSGQSVNEQAADLLDLGLGEIAERGWCQHALISAQGEVCAVGAIEVVIDANGGSRVWAAAYRALMAVVGDVVGFNNHPDTTVEDVTLAFKQAAHNLRTGVSA